MIRPTIPEDADALLQLAEDTGYFKPREIVALREVLDDYHATEHALGHRAVTFEKDGKIQGFAYFAPTPMTDRTWHLYWIVVRKNIQAQGIGSQLLRFTEEQIKAAGGRLFLIETSALPLYELTRKFYLKHGFEQHASIADYYGDGDTLVVFRKRLDS